MACPVAHSHAGQDQRKGFSADTLRQSSRPDARWLLTVKHATVLFFLFIFLLLSYGFDYQPVEKVTCYETVYSARGQRHLSKAKPLEAKRHEQAVDLEEHGHNF